VITDLAVYQKTYDLYLYTYKFIKKFPKAERFLISQVLQSSLIEAIKLMVRANQQRDQSKRRQHQDGIEEWLTVYLTALRLAHDLNFLPKRKYAYASSLVAEILKILAGWKKV